MTITGMTTARSGWTSSPLRKNDPKYYAPERVKQREERYQRIHERIAKEEAKRLGTSVDVRNQEIHNARQHARAEMRIEHYGERQNPGFTEHIKASVEEWGDVSYEAGQAIHESEFGPQIVDMIYANPETIAEINQMSPRELDKLIARVEGAIEERGRDYSPRTPRLPAPQAAQPKRISTAPPPVTTIAGKSHQSGKTPDQMSYDEYRKWREKQIAAKRR